MMRTIVKGTLVVGLIGLASLGVGRLWQRPAATPLACQFAVGDELAFRLTSVAEAQGPGQSSRQELRAQLWWKVTAQGGKEWTAVAALSDLALSGDESEERRSGLSLPFQVQIGTDCRLRQIRFEPTSSPKSRQEIEGILRAAEVILPGAPVAEWVSRHRESSADFDARYQRVDSRKDVLLSRQKLRYTSRSLPLLPDGGAPLRISIGESKAELRLDPSGRWVQEAQDHTRLRFERGSQLLSEVVSAVHLVRDTTGGSAPALLSQVDVATLSAQTSDKVKLAAEVPLPPPPDPVLAQLDLSEALLDFGKGLTATKDGLHHATLRLASYLSTHPQAIDELLLRMKSGAIDEKLHSALFLALERTGSRAAERGLASALHDRSMSQMNRMRAAAALQDIPRPSATTAQTLIAEARDSDSPAVANSALLAMGALSRRAQKLAPDAAELIRSDLRQRMQATTRSEDLKVMLDAVGNSGDRELASALQNYRHDESNETRAQAARAYRRMDVAVMEPELASWLKEEKDSQVSRAIGQSLAERLRETAQAPSSDTIQAAAARLAVEQDSRARAALISVLGLAAGSDEAAKKALVLQFHNESEVPLKVQIGRYVRAEDLAL